MALTAHLRLTPEVQPVDDMIDLAWQGVQNHSKSSHGMSQQLAAATVIALLVIYPSSPCISAWFLKMPP